MNSGHYNGSEGFNGNSSNNDGSSNGSNRGNGYYQPAQQQYIDFRNLSPAEREQYIRNMQAQQQLMLRLQAHQQQQQQLHQQQQQQIQLQQQQQYHQQHQQYQAQHQHPQAAFAMLPAQHQAQFMVRQHAMGRPTHHVPQANQQISPSQPLQQQQAFLNPSMFSNAVLYTRPMSANGSPPSINPAHLRSNASDMAPPPSSIQIRPPSMPALSTSSTPVQSFDERILNNEAAFNDHLVKFYEMTKSNPTKPPQINERPLSLLRLYSVVTSLHGFRTVSESRKWPFVAQAMQPFHPEADASQLAPMLRNIYFTYLWAYEQHYFSRRPISKIEWPRLDPENRKLPATAQAAVSAPATPPAAARLPFIPDSDLQSWRSVASGMNINLSIDHPTIDQVHRASLSLQCPNWPLRLETLRDLDNLLIHSKIVSALTNSIVSSLLDAFYYLWSEVKESIPLRKSATVVENLILKSVNESRALFPEPYHEAQLRLNVARQLTSLLRTLVVSVRPEILKGVAEHRFLHEEVVGHLFEFDDYEIYKNGLATLEGISLVLPGATYFAVFPQFFDILSDELQEVFYQVRALPVVLSAGSIFAQLSMVCEERHINTQEMKDLLYQQVVQLAQMWKSIPMHIFLMLQGSLQALYNDNSESLQLSKQFIKSLCNFFKVFAIPTAAFVVTFRRLVDSMHTVPDQQGELLKLMDTVLYSPMYNLTDGGYLELVMGVLLKSIALGPVTPSEVAEDIENDLLFLLEALNSFWRHPAAESLVLAPTGPCFNASSSASTGSPSKKPRFVAQPGNATLLITKGASHLSSTFSHPIQVLQLDIELLTLLYEGLSPGAKLAVIERSVSDWIGPKQQECVYGRQVLTCDRIEASLNLLREKIRLD